MYICAYICIHMRVLVVFFHMYVYVLFKRLAGSELLTERERERKQEREKSRTREIQRVKTRKKDRKRERVRKP